MKFLKSFTPADINKLCKEYKVKISITAVDPKDETIYHHVLVEDPPGSGKQVIQTVSEKWERIELQSTREIRSWSDLFQIGNQNAIFLTDKEKEALK